MKGDPEILLNSINKHAQKNEAVLLTRVELVSRATQRHALPILESCKVWLYKQIYTVPPKTFIGEAIRYTLSQWPKLIVYLQDGRLEISNNRTERAIKPFATGRKNWMFANSVEGAQAAANIYSFIQTCQYQKIESYNYLRYVLAHIRECTIIEQLEALLPFNIDTALLK